MSSCPTEMGPDPSSAASPRSRSCRPPLVAREESLDVNALEPFAREALSTTQQHWDQMIRTTSQAITALGVVCAAMYLLKEVLVPFVLALALKYLLTPLIDALSCRGHATCRFRIPRGVAVFCALSIALTLLLILALILVKSISIFADRADFYASRVTELLTNAVRGLQLWLPAEVSRTLEGVDLRSTVGAMLQDVSLSPYILSLLGTAAHVAENVLYMCASNAHNT